MRELHGMQLGTEILSRCPARIAFFPVLRMVSSPDTVLAKPCVCSLLLYGLDVSAKPV